MMATVSHCCHRKEISERNTDVVILPTLMYYPCYTGMHFKMEILITSSQHFMEHSTKVTT